MSLHYTVCEDGGVAAPDLFYAFDRGLFMNAKRGPSVVQSVVSEETRELPGN